jgi:hypothetical protein
VRQKPASEENRSPAVGRIPWRVVAVRAQGTFVIRVTFADGTEGDVDLTHLVHSSKAGVFEALRDPTLFEGVHVSHGAVTWPGELDLAPDAMHDEIKANGRYVIRP